ncbi:MULTISPECIES: hypothetical protein [unclassified Nocardioides]|uniref:hypothetical protein n=1 Tax=unclassified Nocardioides TaxID=2615069 RepID=UPI0000EB63F9|nr:MULTISPECIES: hypothetical protein [unclassified Nocardioides]ABL84134.1 hypothetical protein Noca_4639 [Nocardioides sp. JS614]
MSAMRSSAPACPPAAARTPARRPAHHRRVLAATVALTAATVVLSAASAELGVAPADAGLALPPAAAPPPGPAVGPVDGHLPGQLLTDGDAQGSTRLQVNWGNQTPLQGQPVTIRGSAPVPSNRASRWVYLEEQATDSKVWGYLKDTRTDATGQFSLELTLERVNEPRRFRIRLDKAPGAPSVASAPATFSAVWKPAGPRTVTYPGLTLVWPGAEVLVGSTQVVVGTLATGLTRASATLQRQVAGQWADVASSPVTGLGAFTLDLPTTYLSHGEFRVRVAANGTAAVETPAQSVVAVPDYTPAGRAGSYALVSPSPVGRWNPCAPISYRVNTAKAPPGALPDVRTALEQITQATGLRFDYRGPTDVVPFAAGNTFDPAVADLVIAWADPAQMRGLFPAGTLGVGGPEFRAGAAVDPAGRPVRQIYQGGVTINTTFNKDLKPGAGEGLTRVAALMHEIGHAVGLMHVTGDEAQLMSPSIGYGLDRWGAGDLAGLELVGSGGGCVTPAA